MRALPSIAVPPVLALLAACGQAPEPVPEASRDRSRTAAVPVEWVEIDGIEFPAGMAEAPPEVVEAYVFAARHPEVLRYMPCYCGCENPRFAHMNNYDCFVDAIDTTGQKPRVDPDPMGFGWGICIDIAREAMRQYERGTPLPEIREIVERKYSRGLPGTPTPHPPAGG